MKVNSNKTGDISFNGFMNSKVLKRSLEFAADNGALFAATTTLILSACARPAAILAAPKTDKENKKVACAKSISSSISGYLLMLALSTPVSRALKKIDNKPTTYLKKESIEKFKDGYKKLSESKAYILATQIFKLGLGLIVACPKAILTTMGMPYIMEYLFHQPPPKKKYDDNDKNEENLNLTFKGKFDDKLAKGFAKIFNNEKFQNFAKKYKDSNFPMHIIAGTDALTTATFIHQTMESDKIEERRKLPVAYNAFISTGLSITSSYGIDRLMDKPTERFIKKFKEINRTSPKLDKYLEGIKVAKPILIVGCIYYIVIPFISTFLADIAEKTHRHIINHEDD